MFPGLAMTTGTHDESGDNHHNRPRDPRDRIAAFMQAHQQPQPRQVAQEDVQKLQAAAGKLDQLLEKAEAQSRSKQVTDQDLQTLKAAAGKLDDLLAGRGQARHD
jgi:phage FluMu protein gp41